MKKTFKTCRVSSFSRSGMCLFDCFNKQITCDCKQFGTTYVDEESEIENLDFQKKNQDSTSLDNQIIDCSSYSAQTPDQLALIFCASFKPQNRLLGNKITDNCYLKFIDGSFQVRRSRDVMPAIFWPSGEREDFESINHHSGPTAAASHGKVTVSKKKSDFDACRKSEHF
ncbi:hypothetical protein M153_95000507, partial [Pseudoloma neurophilia]